MTHNEREQLLRLLEENSRLSAKDIAAALGKEEAEVAACIARLEAEDIICGYRSVINWEKDKSGDVTALVELRVTPQGGDGYNKIADEIRDDPQVETLYLMSGTYDFLVILKGGSLREISLFISDKLASIDEVQSTTTHFILTKYKELGVSLACRKTDGRMMVTP